MNVSKEPIEEVKERQLKEPGEVAKERLNRILATLNLKTPDIVPIMGAAGDFMVHYGGLTWEELSFKMDDKVVKALVKYQMDFPADFTFLLAPYALEGFGLAIAFSEYPDFSNQIRFIWGPLHDILKDKWSRWPGRELSKNYHPQFLGGEHMEPREYKHLIDDPVEFMHSTILPRVAQGLGRLGTHKWSGAMVRIGLVLHKIYGFMSQTFRELSKLGAVFFPMTNAYTPADIIGDFLRHPTGAMLDMRRHPDDFKAACESLVKPVLKVATAIPATKPTTLFFIPLHLNEMLPPKLYNEFYWPYLKKIIMELLGKGYKGFVIFEGDHTPHLDTLLELPKGWGIGWFERPKNFMKVWETLKGHTTVMGGVPISLIAGGTPDKIEEHVRKLMENIKPEGGFIIAPSIGELPPKTPPENYRAYINAALKYGRY